MKLYTHYKDKPYRYIGEAKHSETLDDLVVYETLYENKLGKLWVRPKKMFFETVQVDGKEIPRFKEVLPIIEQFEKVTDEVVKVIAPICEKALGKWDRNWFQSRVKNHTKFHVTIAYVEGKAVGFKLGYGHDSETFYSWLGGVLPEYRGFGIASALMKSQHDWCKKQGYSKIQTKTQNRFREMLILNIRNGFDVVGCQSSFEGDSKIILEKRLL